MMEIDKERCTEMVSARDGWGRRWQCRNRAKWASGKCGLHDPTKIRERATKRGPGRFVRERMRRAAVKADRIKRAAEEITRFVKVARIPAFQAKVEDILKEVFSD